MLEEYNYTFRGEVASKKNSKRLVKCKGRTILLPSAAYEKWAKEARKVILASGKPSKPLERATLMIKIFHGDMLKRDTNNATQGVQDILTEMGVIEDDNWMVIGSPTVGHFIDVEDPRMEVTVSESFINFDFKKAFDDARKEKKKKQKEALKNGCT